MCFALVISAGFPRSLVKIRQVLFRQTSQITRVLNLNCSADLSKDGWWKSRNLLSWQLKSRNLLFWQMNLETSCLGKLLISWFNPQALTQLSGGSKSYDPELIPEGHSCNGNVNHSYKGSIGMVKVHLFSLQIYKWHLLNWQAAKTLWYCVASTLHFWLCQVAALYQKGSDKWVIPSCYFKTNQNYKGENMHIQKVILPSDLLLSPPTLQIEIFRA